ncbi:hypothetical protein GCM10020367_55650 [Streptomyces sannanensis]|uniref:Secreted protein n=1 Tax=Streptomyces sannanensis TaxID=285536 RepID=A0ABP6SJJ6_9ACTN
MRTVRTLAAALVAGTALLGLAGCTAEETPSASSTSSPSQNTSRSTGSSTDEDTAKAPAEAGTSFRTATVIRPGQSGTAQASTGDYLYWQFPADAEDRTTVRATVKLPDAATRHGSHRWQLDVYDGLRRHQACRYGSNSKSAPAGAASVELSCALRTVRAWSEPWANDPLPGAYYIRLTVTDAPDQDLGLPVSAEVSATTDDVGGASSVDGSLAEPLVPASGPSVEPEDGWSSGWWSSRWLWTAGGAALAALAGIWGYTLTRGNGRPRHVPPGL